MSKYIKINDEDVIEITEKSIGEEQYCWNCVYFFPPGGCRILARTTEPFSSCDEWCRTRDRYIKQSQEVINKCCKMDHLIKTEKCNNYLKECQIAITRYLNDILEATDIEYKEPELRSEFIKKIREIEENDNITPHEE